MNKLKFALTFSSLTLGCVASFSAPIPIIRTNFSSIQDCSTYLQNFANQYVQDDSFLSWFYKAANTQYLGYSSSSKNCSNSNCTWTFTYFFNNNNQPAGGACGLVNTTFWNQMAQQLQTENALMNNNGTSLASTFYGVVCTNNTGQTPPKNFSGCTLISK